MSRIECRLILRRLMLMPEWIRGGDERTRARAFAEYISHSSYQALLSGASNEANDPLLAFMELWSEDHAPYIEAQIQSCHEKYSLQLLASCKAKQVDAITWRFTLQDTVPMSAQVNSHKALKPQPLQHAMLKLGKSFVEEALTAFAELGVMGVKSVGRVDRYADDVQDLDDEEAFGEVGCVSNDSIGSLLAPDAADIIEVVTKIATARPPTGISGGRPTASDQGFMYSLSPSLCGRLFPYHILISQEGCVLQVGPAIMKLQNAGLSFLGQHISELFMHEMATGRKEESTNPGGPQGPWDLNSLYSVNSGMSCVLRGLRTTRGGLPCPVTGLCLQGCWIKLQHGDMRIEDQGCDGGLLFIGGKAASSESLSCAIEEWPTDLASAYCSLKDQYQVEFSNMYKRVMDLQKISAGHQLALSSTADPADPADPHTSVFGQLESSIMTAIADESGDTYTSLVGEDSEVQQCLMEMVTGRHALGLHSFPEEEEEEEDQCYEGQGFDWKDDLIKPSNQTFKGQTQSLTRLRNSLPRRHFASIMGSMDRLSVIYSNPGVTGEDQLVLESQNLDGGLSISQQLNSPNVPRSLTGPEQAEAHPFSSSSVLVDQLGRGSWHREPGLRSPVDLQKARASPLGVISQAGGSDQPLMQYASVSRSNQGDPSHPSTNLISPKGTHSLSQEGSKTPEAASKAAAAQDKTQTINLSAIRDSHFVHTFRASTLGAQSWTEATLTDRSRVEEDMTNHVQGIMRGRDEGGAPEDISKAGISCIPTIITGCFGIRRKSNSGRRIPDSSSFPDPPLAASPAAAPDAAVYDTLARPSLDKGIHSASAETNRHGCEGDSATWAEHDSAAALEAVQVIVPYVTSIASPQAKSEMKGLDSQSELQVSSPTRHHETLYLGGPRQEGRLPDTKHEATSGGQTHLSLSTPASVQVAYVDANSTRSIKGEDLDCEGCSSIPATILHDASPALLATGVAEQNNIASTHMNASLKAEGVAINQQPHQPDSDITYSLGPEQHDLIPERTMVESAPGPHPVMSTSSQRQYEVTNIGAVLSEEGSRNVTETSRDRGVVLTCVNRASEEGSGAASATDASAAQLLKPIVQEKVHSALSRMDDWAFDSFELATATGNRPLSTLAFALIKRSGITLRLRLEERKLARFLICIEDGYRDNPYHCRIHAADVLRNLHVIVTQGQLLQVLARNRSQVPIGTTDVNVVGMPAAKGTSSVAGGDNGSVPRSHRSSAVHHHQTYSSREIVGTRPCTHGRFMSTQDAINLLSMYLSAIIHDHDHRGLTNAFLVQDQDPLALLYNDQSPMENHHVASAFAMLMDDQNNFMCNFSRKAWDAVRSIVIQTVLGTDMKQHFSIISMFNTKVAACMATARADGSGNAAVAVPQGMQLKAQGSLRSYRKVAEGHRSPVRMSSVLETSKSPSFSTRTSSCAEVALSPQRSGVSFSEVPLELHSPLLLSTSRRNHMNGTSMNKYVGGLKSGEDSAAAGTGGGVSTTLSQHSLPLQMLKAVDRPSSFVLANNSMATFTLSDLPMDDELYSLVWKMAMKCSDLGHLASAREVHLKWVGLLEEEMFLQGDLERSRGYPISPLMDRNQIGITRSQVGFFNVIVLPLFKGLASVLPSVQPLLDQVLSNFQMWSETEALDKVSSKQA
ncbi:hypothetical protein CEUSTIGMA_g12757.t1 [Chlamydomonas eustigma]|uniref:PDEase domain-containing protein n=1 Tax=Chlamydomonas eustigma TaxID=1157962 RepID=A0A250XRA3_9CHLO|nr:hypothetical protein CEUSTIGMA_g12757.t1 [Chlamydomonas eustigma]|eukprot:GAX85340.1 hypothetical protein CEUSTIGMA_g12757.t1 [Chlamydomonas eustigma]